MMAMSSHYGMDSTVSGTLIPRLLVIIYPRLLPSLGCIRVLGLVAFDNGSVLITVYGIIQVTVFTTGF